MGVTKRVGNTHNLLFFAVMYCILIQHYKYTHIQLPFVQFPKCMSSKLPQRPVDGYQHYSETNSELLDIEKAPMAKLVCAHDTIISIVHKYHNLVLFLHVVDL